MQRPPRRLVSALLATALFLGFALIFRGSVIRVLAVAQRPLVAAGTWVGQRAVGLFDAAAVSPERLSRLEAERAAAAVDRAELERLSDENAELRAQLDFLNRHSYHAVGAEIISRSLGPEASVFVIDRGSDDGIVLGAPAVSGDGILVGKVIETTNGSATVRVISDRASATAVMLLNGVRTIGIAQGISGALLNVTYIPQDETISINNVVVTSGLEPDVPAGLLVGIVNAVDSNPNAPFQQAVLEPVADARRLRVVSVLLPEQAL